MTESHILVSRALRRIGLMRLAFRVEHALFLNYAAEEIQVGDPSVAAQWARLQMVFGRRW